MAKTIIGVFPDRHVAEHAVDELLSYGYRNDEISIVMKDSEDIIGEKYGIREYPEGSGVAGGAISGAVTGGIIGGLAGLLIGVGAIAIPGIDALLIAAPISAALGLTGAAATTVSGAITGAVAGGLIGALISLGVPEDESRVYEDRVRSGGVIVAVPATIEEEPEVRDLLSDNGAENLRSIDTAREEEEEYRRPYAGGFMAGMKGGRTKRESASSRTKKGIRNDKFDDEF